MGGKYPAEMPSHVSMLEFLRAFAIGLQSLGPQLAPWILLGIVAWRKNSRYRQILTAVPLTYMSSINALDFRERSRIIIAVARKRKNPYAVALGRKGGRKGGPARAANMTPEQRSESARNAVLARWAKVNKENTDTK